VLVTSRERLRVQGEQVYPVPALERVESRELFAARARAVQPGFEPDEHVTSCARSSTTCHLRSSSPRRGRRCCRPSSSSTAWEPTRPPAWRPRRRARQRTLRATIEWSYELLTPEEQRLLAALSVFRGGWTVEAAERVCEADLELQQSLADKSLVRRWESSRFGMLETVREFAGSSSSLIVATSSCVRLLELLTETFEPNLLLRRRERR
jgi:predicted ATPase